MLPVHFAPLQGFTESSYRLAHYRNAPGIDTYYTPFLRLEKGEIRPKDLRNLEADRLKIRDGRIAEGDLQQKPPYRLVPQIIVRDAEEFETLTAAVSGLGFKRIDINMGCPFPMQTKSGRGSGLLKHPEKVREILDAVARHGKGENPVRFSVKMRIGLDSPEDSLRLLPLLNDAPLVHVALHPRLGIQQYKGALHFDIFDLFYKECKHPFLFNGDLADPVQIKSVEERYPGLAGIMIGRGLLANPVLAAQYAGIPCGNATETLLKIHAEVFLDYRQRLQGDAQVLDKLRPFWTYAELPKKIRKRIEKSRTLEEYLEAVESMRQA